MTNTEIRVRKAIDEIEAMCQEAIKELDFLTGHIKNDPYDLRYLNDKGCRSCPIQFCSPRSKGKCIGTDNCPAYRDYMRKFDGE